ncbi:5,10-methylene-tetrahydrofolate dehydrogenase/methenyl tetrahydrofolate cyclohydrolase [Bradyrhizobium sp. i1.4.4]
MNAIVIGRSNLVGRPLVQLLLNENATVTIAHSRSRDLPGLVKRADLVYAAVGKPEMVRGDWLKPGATVIDIGINRIPKDDGKTRLVGDVAYQEALAVAGAITPVPGGVGPDDGRLPAGEYAARGVRDRRAAEAGGLGFLHLSPLAGRGRNSSVA